MDAAVIALVAVIVATAGITFVARSRDHTQGVVGNNGSPGTAASPVGAGSPHGTPSNGSTNSHSPSARSPVANHSPSTAPATSPSHSASPLSGPTASPTTPPSPTPVQTQPPSGVPHIMVIVEENNSYNAIIGNSQLPYINSLASQYASLTNWWGVSHPSEPNYLAMVSGSIWTNPADLTPQDQTYAGPTVVDQLAAKGIAWKAYMEDMPKACDLTDQYSPGDYDVNHNPFMYFTSIRNSSAQCNRDVPFTQFAGDLANGTAPPFMYVVPNLLNDMHNGTYATADNWVKAQLALVFASSWYAQGGTVVLTWDEGESGGDQIATVVIAARLAGHGPVSAFGNHFGLLRSLEEIYGLAYLANAASASNGDIKSLL
jgi:acid phosphatase